MITLISLQHVAQITVVNNVKVVRIFGFVQGILGMIIKTVPEVKIVKTVKINNQIKLIIKQRPARPVLIKFRLKMAVVKTYIHILIVVH